MWNNNTLNKINSLRKKQAQLQSQLRVAWVRKTTPPISEAAEARYKEIEEQISKVAEEIKNLIPQAQTK
jgi:hypothetical protein